MVIKHARVGTLVLALALTGCATTMSNYKETENFRGTRLDVNLANGQMQTSTGALVNFNPVNFTIANGKCKKVLLTQVSQPTTQVPVHVCYRENKFYLDSHSLSGRQTDGAIHFNYIPLWRRGFTYHSINTSGHAHLTGTEVTLNILNFNKPAVPVSSH